MRPAILLAQLALWASSTHAFFPYTPAWMEVEEDVTIEAKRDVDARSPRGLRLDIKQRAGQYTRPAAERAAREAERLKTKYSRRRSSRYSRKTRSPSKRENGYKIMAAEDTGKAMSAGVDQDGTDYSYFVEVELGSKGKKMYMLIDTGAGSSWVMGSDCDSKACTLHNSFGPDDSDTMENSNKPFSIAYGSGKVSGDLVTDTIGVAGMSFKYQFGLATTTSDQFVSFAFDGILGLAINDGANENFLSTMDEANEVDSNIFCIALSRASDGKNNGEIRFGSTNPDKYTGDISYTSLGEGDDWAIEIDDMSYDGKKASVGGIQAYIDSGTSFIFGPKDMVKKVHDAIPGAESSDGTSYTVPCDSDKPVTLTFSGVDYEISTKDWISPQDSKGKCTSNIYGQEVVKGSWLLGDTFIKNVYTVFDKDKKRIGFAKNTAVDTDDSSSETTTTSNSSSGGSSTTGPTKTSSNSAAATSADGTKTTLETSATSLADTTQPDMGLGRESKTDASATSEAAEASPTEDDESAAGSQSPNVKYASIFCILAFFTLMT